ncbi:MAG: translation initiation factor IF-2 [Saprospiraceae bacterium]
MAKRVLVKVATELNVGKDSIVEHLLDKGFDIDNKPNAKISDEMYDELVKQFSNDMAIKDKADQLVIGTRPSQKKEGTPVKEKSTLTFNRDEFKSKPFSLRPETKTPDPEPEPEPVKEEAPKEPEVVQEEKPEVKEEETKRPGLKVVGKIDLDAKPKKKEPKKEEPVKEEEKAETPKETPAKEEKAPEKSEEKEKPAKEEPKGETPKSDKEKSDAPATEAPKEGEPATDAEGGLIRAETPELRGLKILGKIDADKLKGPKKKKKKEPGKPETTAKTDDKQKADGEGGDDAKRRRRRKRRKVTTTTGGTGDRRPAQNKGGKSKKDEVKEISQKEIDDKIKATMARLQGGSKKKRQKLRRETRERLREKQEEREMEQELENLQVTEFISVSELASLMDVSPADVITTCMNLGVIVSINQRLDAEIIELVANEYGHEIEFISAEDIDDEEEEIVDDPEDLEPRAPIVTVMGHVDHGKTSLLDYIRKANVAGGEAGGITQHIGAYEVEVNEKKITFLDTPGHEAFTAMRARGAKVTDIAVIIVAADDGIMPQTREAISHAQAAGVPLVFAINKIDKDGANPNKIKEALANMNILVEEWGGKYQSQDISAKTGLGIDALLEKIILEAELLELNANPDRPATGTILEASLEKGRGYATKMLVENGTLEIGDSMVAGEYSGKVKAMFNERGKRVKVAGPSTPVLVLGLDGAPQAGERLKVYESEQEARQIASRRAQINREQANRATKRISLDEIGRRLALGTFKELNLIVKGDVDGSIEALSDSLLKLSQETVQVNVIHKAVGQIIESDVLLASASDAIIIGFQVRPSLNARRLAEKEGVQIKMYSIIYEAIDEIKSAIEGLLEPTREEKIVGQVEVRDVFKISKVGTIAGCFVQEGKIMKNNYIRLIRDGIVVYPTREGIKGELASLKRFKDDVKEVRAGMECGIGIKNFNDIKVGDVIEAYEIIEVKQKLA